MIPAIAMAVVAFVAVLLQAAMVPSVKSAGVAVLVALVGVVVGVIAACGAEAANRRVRSQHEELMSAHAGAQQQLRLSTDLSGRIEELRSLVAHGRDDVEQLAKRLINGERIAFFAPGDLRFAGGDPVVLLACDLEELRAASLNAVIRVAQQIGQGRPAHAVQVYASLARRMQSRAHKTIRMLDKLERRVVDPNMLKALFAIDHQVTIMRRQAENMAVICGEASRRRWSDPQPISKVLRSSVVEVEDYPRVRVAAKVQGALEGDAVSDVVHLVAELIENATKFSKPGNKVLVRTQIHGDGLVIEVADEGLGMPSAEVEGWNAFLAAPGRPSVMASPDERRIGLTVVAALAGRHGVRVSLRSELHRGTTAYVELPTRMLHTAADRRSRPVAQPLPEAATPPAPASAGPVTFRPVSTAPSPVAGPGRPQVPATTHNDRGSAVPRSSGQAMASTPPPTSASGTVSAQGGSGQGWSPPVWSAPGGEQPPATTRRPLPQRVPQQSLPEQLRGGASRPSEDSDTDPTPDLIADFKKGAGHADEPHDRL